MGNRLIPASEVAKDFVESINAATQGMSEDDSRDFMKELVEWLYQLNGFTPIGPKDN